LQNDLSTLRESLKNRLFGGASVQQLDFFGRRKLEWKDVSPPRLAGDREALVRPFAVATCDLDRTIINGAAPVAGPFPFGHEGVAEVVEAGDGVRNFKPGDIVSIPFQISCGECAQCRRGRTAHCVAVERMSMYGLGPLGGGSWGGFLSDLVRVPFADHMLVAVPPGVDPLAVASLSDNIVDGWRLVAPQLEADPGAAVLIVAGARSLARIFEELPR
jgi:alcohol dehydrogenase